MRITIPRAAVGAGGSTHRLLVRMQNGVESRSAGGSGHSGSYSRGPRADAGCRDDAIHPGPRTGGNDPGSRGGQSGYRRHACFTATVTPG